MVWILMGDAWWCPEQDRVLGTVEMKGSDNELLGRQYCEFLAGFHIQKRAKLPCCRLLRVVITVKCLGKRGCYSENQ